MLSGILAAIHGQAALFIGASLPLVGVGVHFLVPLSSHTSSILVSVANKIVAVDRLATLLKGAAKQGAIILLWLPLSGRVTNLWKANELVAALLVRPALAIGVGHGILRCTVDPLRGITAFPVLAAFPLTAFRVSAAQALARVHQELHGIITACVLTAGLLLTALLFGAAYEGTRLGLPLGVVGAHKGIALQLITASLTVRALEHVGPRLQSIVAAGSTDEVFAEQWRATLRISATFSCHAWRLPNVEFFVRDRIAASVGGTQPFFTAVFRGASYQTLITFVLPLRLIGTQVWRAIVWNAASLHVESSFASGIVRMWCILALRAFNTLFLAKTLHAAA